LFIHPIGRGRCGEGVLVRSRFNGSPKALELKLIGFARSRAVGGVKRAEGAPAIMQSPNHGGKF